jgi:7-cyano-7-deazaguanine reductase
MRYDSVSRAVLKSIPHRGGPVEVKHKAPEVTFLGVHDQPDFAELFITIIRTKG